MKRQISNEHAQIIPLRFLLIGLTIASIITILFFNDFSRFETTVSIVLLLVFGIIAWSYSTRFYRVSFDADFIYFSRFRRTQRIDLGKVIDVKPGVFPFRIFYRDTYVVTITYLDIDIKKKIRFLSKGSFRNAGSIKSIPHLDKLKQLVLEKKYGR